MSYSEEAHSSNYTLSSSTVWLEVETIRCKKMHSYTVNYMRWCICNNLKDLLTNLLQIWFIIFLNIYKTSNKLLELGLSVSLLTYCPWEILCFNCWYIFVCESYVYLAIKFLFIFALYILGIFFSFFWSLVIYGTFINWLVLLWKLIKNLVLILFD